jgi:hypothetical protein
MPSLFGRTAARTASLMLLLLISLAAMAQYKLTNLTSNQKGKAKHFDPNLVNGWGLTFAPDGPIFVADTGTGSATAYNAAGVPQKTVVTVPSASGTGLGSPTGIAWPKRPMMPFRSGSGCLPPSRLLS